MPTPQIQQYFSSAGIDTYTSPLVADGKLIHSVNMISDPLGGKKKRPGYITYLNAPDSAQVNSMFQFQKNDGTTLFNYRASGSLLYYSLQGTGDWTIAGNGTISNGAHVGHAVLNNTLIIGDGAGSTRHTTNGTSFTNTTAAPVAPFFEQYQNRVYAVGTAGTVVYSSPFAPTDWTTDSSSFTIPGAGLPKQPFKSADRLVFPKNSGEAYRWDGFSLTDMSTDYAPSSPYAIANIEGYTLSLNRYGINGYGGGQFELLSNAIQRKFYNSLGSSISGTTFDNAPAGVWRYDYLVSVGTVTDDFTRRTIPDNIIKYNFQQNEFLDWQFTHNPTAYMNALDTAGNRNLYFGDANGNTFVMSGTATSDAGSVINAEMIYVYTYGAPEFEKDWQYYRGIFNPGCEGKVQYGTANTFTNEEIRWHDMGDIVNGIVEKRFDERPRSRLLFERIYEASTSPAFSSYGRSISATVEEKY